jgi:Cupin domain
MQIVDFSNTEHYLWGAACDGWHLVKRDDLSVITERVPPGESEQRHFHNYSRQFFYILVGEAVIEVDGERKVLQALLRNRDTARSASPIPKRVEFRSYIFSNIGSKIAWR